MSEKTACCKKESTANDSLSYEKVLRVFSGYLKQDKEIEIVRVEHGYAILVWNEEYQNYTGAETVTSPQELAEQLAGSYNTFLLMLMSGEGAWDLTPEEKTPAEQSAQALLAKCLEN